MKKILAFLCALGCCQNLSAQKTLYLKPFIGRQTTLSRFDKNFDNPDDVTVRPLSMNWSPGAYLVLKLNDDWTVQSGVESGFTGWHFKQKNPAGNFAGNQKGESAYHRADRLQLLVQRRLATVMALNLNPEKNIYLLNFDFYVSAGLSYNMIPSRSGPYPTDTTIIDRYVYNRRPEYDYAYHKFLRWHSGAIYIGFGTQFYHQDNARFDFTVFYSQGLTDVMVVEVNYRQGDNRHIAKLRTRVSVIGATLAYPIRLKTFERKSV